MRIWQLPGPRRFLRDAANDVLDGKSLVLQFPAGSAEADDLKSELARQWTQEQESPMVFAASAPDSPPARTLGDALELAPGAKLNPAALCVAAPGSPGQLVWVDGVSAAQWPEWRSFLLEFQRSASSAPPYQRNRLIVLLEGDAAVGDGVHEVGAATRRWDDVLDTQDALLLAAQLLRDRPQLRAGLRVLLAASIAQVALFDLELVDRLSGEPIDRILRPGPLLSEICRERGWEEDQEPAWRDGSGARLEGRFRAHAALCRAGDGPEERLWRAQVSVVFPAIEEHRRIVARKLAAHLRIPYETEFGRVEDVNDLEIGHLYRQVTLFDLPLPAQDREQLGAFRDARNALAHGETLTAEELLGIIL